MNHCMVGRSAWISHFLVSFMQGVIREEDPLLDKAIISDIAERGSLNSIIECGQVCKSCMST